MSLATLAVYPVVLDANAPKSTLLSARLLSVASVEDGGSWTCCCCAGTATVKSAVADANSTLPGDEMLTRTV